MIKILKYIGIIMLGTICLTCKKKTSIQVHVFNPALDEYVPNATVVLVEKTGDGGGGLFGGADAKCKEIATATSDANGNCYFEKEKLKRSNGYDYFCVVKESWGISQGYSCANHTSGFIDKGKANDIIVTDQSKAYLQVQYNNLLNPSQSGDSLIVSLTTIEYPNPKGGVVYGGGGGSELFLITVATVSPLLQFSL